MTREGAYWTVLRFLAPLALLAVVLVACSPAATPTVVPNESGGAPTPTTSASRPQDIAVRITCGPAGVWYIDDYLYVGADVRPLRHQCIASWQGGTPGYDVTWTDPFGTETRESPTILRFESRPGGLYEFRSTNVLPFSPPGTYPVAVQVVDSEGLRGAAQTSYQWAWREGTDTVQVSVDGPAGDVPLGEDASLAALARAPGLQAWSSGDTALQGRLGADLGLIFSAFTGDIVAAWDFGDGRTQTETLPPVTSANDNAWNSAWGVFDRGIDARLATAHRYQQPGVYLVTLTVTDQRYGRTGVAKAGVTVVAPGAVPTPTPTAVPASLEDGIRVQVHRVVGSVEPRFGYVTGEITNTNAVRVRISNMYLELSDGTRPNSAFLLFDVLEPGQTTPFIEMYLNDGDLAPKTVLGVAEWRVQPAPDPLDRTLADQIEVSDVRIFPGSQSGGFQYYQVAATLTNRSPNTVRLAARMIVRLDGEVIDLKHASSGADIAPGKSAVLYWGTTISPEPPAQIAITPLAACRDCS